MTDSARPPNVLLFITDQFHPGCLGYAGHPVVRTPHIDRLAASGMTFSRMYTPQPLCLPARASLFTGLSPRGHRVRMNGIPLDPTIPTVTGALSNAGYHTHCCGKIHLSVSVGPNGVPLESLDPRDFPECGALWRQGRIRDLPTPYYGIQTVDFVGGHGHGSFGDYTSWLDREHPRDAHLFHQRVAAEPPGPAFKLFNRQCYKWALPHELHPTRWIADRTIDYLRDPARREQPFCLMCSFPDPHSPFAAPEPYCHRYGPGDVPPPAGRDGEYDDLPPHFAKMYETPLVTSGNKNEPMKDTTPFRAQCAAQYYGLIELIDDQVGRVMESLEASGLENDTLVLFLADHGEALGDHGMWGKGPYHFDSVIRVPFFARWPGRIEAGTTHEGVSSLLDIAPTILDISGVRIPDGGPPGDPEAPDAASPWPGRSLQPVLRGDDTNTDTVTVVEMDEDYLGFKMRTLVTRRYRLTCYSGQPHGELFDLEEDPDELHNLWNDRERRSLRDGLRLRLLDELMRTDPSTPRQLCRS